MNNPSTLCQVASNIGRMHKLHRRADFPLDIPRETALELRLAKWGKAAASIAAGTLKDNLNVKAMRLDEIFATETTWLPGYLLSYDTGISGQGVL